jgi:cellulose synthase/poly-beta-1,6-N-acetylglucosamine synthase-like glycosyltransferase
MLEVLFYLSIAIIVYAYVLYGPLLYVIGFLYNSNEELTLLSDEELPDVTLLVAAYNEKDFLHEKIKNSQALNYPKNKLKQIWVTDGSDDGTPDIIKSSYPFVKVLHEDVRNGKIGAINRAVPLVNTELVVFCDANTYLSADSIRDIVSLFVQNEKVGCVAGEKKIFLKRSDKASGAGEGIYWKYESFVKKMESRSGNTMGAAGELFAIRTKLFEPVAKTAILDDFMISLKIAEKGYYVKYLPSAFAEETSSISIHEELKRKIRISTGGVQSAIWLRYLLNPFNNIEISFKFFSHKILRWLIVPYCFILTFILNPFLIEEWNQTDFYFDLFLCQVLFYLISLLGFAIQQKHIKLKFLFVPYYITIMNYAAIAGLFRYFKGTQSVNWSRAQRQIVN